MGVWGQMRRKAENMRRNANTLFLGVLGVGVGAKSCRP